MTAGRPSHVAEVSRRLSREIPELIEEHRLPGLAIAICDGSAVLWAAAFGVKEAGGEDSVTTETMFSVQSISKLYTATAVMLAVQDGQVELDAPITTYLPEFTVQSRFEAHPERRMTLRHLLSHTAAFTHEAPEGNNYRVGRASFDAHCRSIAETWLRFPVGHHYEYSNLGIDLAAYILQRVSRLPFHEFVRQRLLVPLGLQHTTFSPGVIARERNRAVGHSGRAKRVPLRIPMVGAGGLYTSVLDAARFVQLHLCGGASLLEQSHLADMYAIPFARPGQEYGYGLGIVSFLSDGLLIRGHSGGGFGFLADVYWAPQPGIGVVVLTNSVTHPLQGTLAQQVLKELAERPVDRSVLLPPEYPPSDAIVRRLTGEYVGRPGWRTIAAEEGRLVLIIGEERKHLRVVAPDEALLEDNPLECLRFLSDGDGVARYVLGLSDGIVWYRNDVPDRVAIPKRWATFEGDYRIEAHGVRISSVRLRSEGGHLLYEDEPGTRSLWLEEYQPGIFYSSTGEVLNLTCDPPTYANIRLHRDPSHRL